MIHLLGLSRKNRSHRDYRRWKLSDFLRGAFLIMGHVRRQIEQCRISRLRSRLNSGKIRIFAYRSGRCIRFALAPFQAAVLLFLISFSLCLFASSLVT